MKHHILKDRPSRKLFSLNIKKLLLPIAAIFILTLTGCSNKAAFDLSNYIVIDGVSGPNGAGVAEYHLNEDQLIVDMLNELTTEKVTEKNVESVMTEQYEKVEEIGNILSCIDIKASPADGLSNGDTVTVTATFDSTKENDLGFVLVNGSQHYQVSGLKEAKTIDLFSDETISVTFSGCSGTGTADVTVLATDEIFSLIDYSISEWQSLSNGDTLTLKAYFDSMKLADAGYLVPEVTEQSIIVSGLDEYINVSVDLPTDLLKKLCAQSLLDSQTLEAAEKYATVTESSEITGAYFLTAKDPTNPYWDIMNDLKLSNALVVSTHYVIESGNVFVTTTNKHYVWIYPNWSQDADGVIDYQSDKDIYYYTIANSQEEVYSFLTSTFYGTTIEELDLAQLEIPKTHDR